VPVAINCVVVPRGILGLVGVTAIDTSVAGVTVSVVLPDMFVAGSMAVIEFEPVAVDVAKPFEPDTLLTLSTLGEDEFQVTDAVISWVELSVYFPRAINFFVVPSGILGLVGVTAIDTSAAGVTVSAVLPDKFVVGSVAMIMVGPWAIGDTIPFEPNALLIFATDVDAVLQITDAVRSFVVLFE
jgi:hypothetical protein